MPRFYLDATLTPHQSLALPDELLQHVQALRLRDGAALTLFNGQGGEYSAVLRLLGRRSAVADIMAYQSTERESPLTVQLVQGVSSGERMDYTVQKAVELGISSVQPLFCERAARVPAERLANRQLHWQRVVIAACEQCGRNQVPTVLPALTWAQWLPQATTGIVLSPLGQTPISQLARPSGPLALLAGPEGGLSAAEEAELLARGWTALTLGPRILRSETAALAALAAMQTLWGDYGAT